jgi:hypothetical protein
MKISLRYALGILLLSPTFLDAQNGTKYYKVDAVTPDGIVVKHAGRVEWVDAPLSDFERRARILSGKDSEVLAGISDVKIAEPALRSAGSGGNSFIYDGSRAPSPGRSAVVLNSLKSSYAAEKTQEVIRHLPGAASPRELPWEFVANEVGMLLLWFHHADESDPTNATISDYIRQQHSPENNILLYRLLVRPWLKKEK